MLRVPRYEDSAKHLGVSSSRQRDTKGSLHSENSNDTVEETSDSSIETQLWDIGTDFWEFDGNFQKCRETKTLKISCRRDATLSIKDLEVYPIQYADDDLVPK